MDPWEGMVEALSSFLDWFIKASSMLFIMEDAPELQELARLMKKLLQPRAASFPRKIWRKVGNSVKFSEGART